MKIEKGKREKDALRSQKDRSYIGRKDEASGIVQIGTMSVLFSPAELHNGVTKPKFNARKQPARKKEDDLLVFGYACTIREDSSKALHFEQEKHLIPWMGDDSLLIDRSVLKLYAK